VASSKDRQRKLARARMERRMAKQAASARKKRQIQAGVGAFLALSLIVVGVFWLSGAFTSKPKPASEVASGSCEWHAQQTSDVIKDTGIPPTSGEPRSGTRTMTIKTNVGEVEAELDLANAPCTAASFNYLSGLKFFDNTPCHRLTTAGIYVLQCGDPSGTGTGGPGYQFANENLPVDPNAPSPDPSAPAAAPTNLYPAGTIAMANSGPDTNGSQFFIVYKDGSGLAGNYTIFGKITKGLDVVTKVADAGAVDTSGKATQDGAPKTKVTIEALTVGPAPGETPTPTPAPVETSLPATPTASASPGDQS
jgi:peptidyl-prolyl cis-trans isomerase B (cyclophilin B)